MGKVRGVSERERERENKRRDRRGSEECGKVGEVRIEKVGQIREGEVE